MCILYDYDGGVSSMNNEHDAGGSLSNTIYTISVVIALGGYKIFFVS